MSKKIKKMVPGYFINRLGNLTIIYPDQTVDVFHPGMMVFIKTKMPYNKPSRHWQIKQLKFICGL